MVSPLDDVVDRPNNDAAVVLIHGFGGGPGIWRDLETVLGHHGYHVVCQSLSGHQSALPSLDQVEWSDWTASVGAHIARLRTEYSKVFVVGHSLGATIALYCAASVSPPDALVLMAPSLTLGLRNRLIVNAHRAARRTTMAWRWVGQSKPPKWWGKPTFPLSALQANLDLKTIADSLLPAVHCPVTLIGSENDRTAPVAELHRIADRLSKSQTEISILPGEAHSIPTSGVRESAFQITLDALTKASNAFAATSAHLLN